MQKLTYSGLTKVASEKTLLQKLGQVTRVRRIFAFYSSTLDCITFDPRFFSLPVDDRMANRAHGVFDNLYIKKLRILRLDEHLKRLEYSGSKMEISLPFSLDVMRQKVLDLCQATVASLLQEESVEKVKDRQIGLRLWLSSGMGDFGLPSLDKQPIFYCATFQPFIDEAKLQAGVKQFITRVVDQDQGPNVSVKSVNYAEQALQNNRAKAKGGYQGVKVTKSGMIRECAMANLGFVTADNKFITPRFETVLKGTTLTKCLQILEQLTKQGLVAGVEARDIRLEEAYTCKEMIAIGGDKVVPVVEFEGRPFEKGPVWKALYERMQELGDLVVPGCQSL